MPRPRARQKIVFRDCFDCMERLDPSVSSEGALAASDAVARQEPPPKALIIYGSGFVRSAGNVINVDDSSFPHLDQTVKEGCLGMLAVRQGTATGPLSPSIMELSQVLGVHEDIQNCTSVAGLGKPTAGSLQDRFKGMQAGFASTSTSAQQLASAVGMDVGEALQLSGGVQKREEGALPLPPAAEYAEKLIQTLDAEKGADGLDLFMLHLNLEDLMPSKAPGAAEQSASGENPSDESFNTSIEALAWLDDLVKSLLASQGIKEQVLLTLMLSCQGRPLVAPSTAMAVGSKDTMAAQDVMQPGGATLDPAVFVITPRSLGAAAQAAPGVIGVLESLESSANVAQVVRPVQSFQKRGRSELEVQASAPILVARRLPGVVRRDRAAKMGLEECNLRSGQGCILADRLLPEMAYKLGRALKYGA